MKTRIFKFACYMQNLELALYIYPIECKGNGLLNAKRKLYIYINIHILFFTIFILVKKIKDIAITV